MFWEKRGDGRQQNVNILTPRLYSPLTKSLPPPHTEQQHGPRWCFHDCVTHTRVGVVAAVWRDQQHIATAPPPARRVVMSWRLEKQFDNNVRLQLLTARGSNGARGIITYPQPPLPTLLPVATSIPWLQVGNNFVFCLAL